MVASHTVLATTAAPATTAEEVRDPNSAITDCPDLAVNPNTATTIFPNLAVDPNTVTAVCHDLTINPNTTTQTTSVERTGAFPVINGVLSSHMVTEKDVVPRVITTYALAQLGPLVTTVVYDGVVFMDIDKFVAPVPTTCSTECLSRDVIASMSALAASATPESSSVVVNFVPELTAYDAGIEAFDIGANGVAALTPTRCSTNCLNDHLNQVLPMSCCVVDCSRGGGCRKHPWPMPQVMLLTGVYCTALIPMKQQFYS